MQKNLSLWIRFGEEGRRKFLARVEACCRDYPPAKKSFEWRENKITVRLECKENDAGRFLLCSVTDVEGKNTQVSFPIRKSSSKRMVVVGSKNQGVRPAFVEGD